MPNLLGFNSKRETKRSWRLPSIRGIAETAIILVLGAITIVVLFQLYSAKVTTGVYKQRLTQIKAQYGELRTMYNQAVEKTAVTELVVSDGKLSVVIRTVEGVIKTIPTPFDPRKEIHVDYVVTQGRLWIRRIHDASTPSDQAMVIDPTLANIEWDTEGHDYGLVIYRPLGEGRWIISTTTNGALTLQKQPSEFQVALVPPPDIRQFDPIDQEIDARLDSIGPIDVVKWLFGSDSQTKGQ